MMAKPVGGRGKKAPYGTVVMRVPVLLAKEFHKQIEAFHDFHSNGLGEQGMATTDYGKCFGYCTKQKYEALMMAKKILASKKSAKVSLQKLLQVLYNDYDLTIE